jgi:bacillithiol system protein YtxJ
MVIELIEQADLERLLERSRSTPVLIFKHSTQCSISSAAYEELTQFADQAQGVECGLVLVIENRTLSDKVAAQFGIRHQSPQAIVIENGQPTWNASHWSITADALAKATRS